MPFWISVSAGGVPKYENRPTCCISACGIIEYIGRVEPCDILNAFLEWKSATAKSEFELLVHSLPMRVAGRVLLLSSLGYIDHRRSRFRAQERRVSSLSV